MNTPDIAQKNFEKGSSRPHLVPVTIPGRLSNTSVLLTTDQAEFWQRYTQWTVHENSIGTISTFSEVIGTIGSLRERVVATLDNDTGKMQFFSPVDDTSISAVYTVLLDNQDTVWLDNWEDMIQFHPDTFVGRIVNIKEAFWLFRNPHKN